ncbi:MAG: DUF2147 domain-containing protein [Silvibacterium sp.]
MKRIWIPILFMFSLAAAQANNGGIFGKWTSPNGSTIEIYRCGANVCAKLISISREAPSQVDAKNPNAAMRRRSLCGLEIGANFHLTKPGYAEGGQLYDPESGRTYSGSMTRDGDKLKLRGYVGISLFGRTEIWTQARGNVSPCHS